MNQINSVFEDPNQSRLKLQADIRLLNIEKSRLQNDIERLESAKVKQYTVLNQETQPLQSEITRLNREKTKLLDEIEHLQTAKERQAKQAVVPSDDVLLLNKEKVKLLDEIERLQKAKASQYAQLNEEITPLKAQRQALIDEVASLAKKSSRIQEESTQEAAGAQVFVNKLTTDAEQVKDRMLLEASTKLASVNAKLVELEVREKQVALKEKDTSELESALSIRSDELSVIEKELTTKKAEFDNKLVGLEEELADNKATLEQTEANITQQTSSLNALNNQIRTKTYEAKMIDDQLAKRVASVTNRELAAVAQDKYLKSKETELKTKEKWLEDREKTLTRAYDEIVAKGGNIDV